MYRINQFVVLVSLLIMASLSFGEDITGREIMQLVENRDDGNDRHSHMEMVLINKMGKTRNRKIESYSKDYGDDSKSVMMFEEPADVKGTGFLSWEYDDVGKDDDRWLYLPALRKVRRISGASNNDYFMGSDFTYDDMGDRNLDEDTYKLVGNETVAESDCYVIECVPKDNDEAYNLRKVWVCKDKNLVVKAEYYDKIGLIKEFTAKEIKLVDGIWTVHEMFMDNFREKHKTRLMIRDVEYNKGLNDRLFTVSTIERGHF